jgi:glucose/arabinose dehydrogenase
LEGPANHDGGGMVIYNGQLYVGVGDTGSNASPPTNKYASCLNKGNGKVLRINLNGSLPSNNPLASLTSVTACTSPTSSWSAAAPDARIFAWGFRNPFRIWVDPFTGLLWVGDVGEVTQEEISVGGGDQHYGYPFVEGSKVWGDVDGKNCSSMVPSRSCTAPAYSYGRSVGTAVTGGLILDRCGWPEVFGGTHYIFGDSSGGWIRVLPVNDARTGFASTTAVLFANYSSPVSFRTGPDGALYVVLYGSGAVYRFTPTAGCGQAVADAQVPTLPAAAMGLLLIALAASAIWIQRRGLSRR